MEREKKIAAFWKKNKIYEKVKAASAKGKKFYFLDGPPYATGYIHMGTALNKVLKDCYIRFWRMRGFNVWDQPGYDTHGLPIENKIEQQLGLKSKADIEKMGVDKFNRKCRSFATKFIGVMNGEFASLGVWMDWPRPYLTLTNEYIESAWQTFKIAFEKGLLYRGLYPVHTCPQCETAVAYNEIVYAKMADPSIYVLFKIRDRKDEYLLIWTTTPWTLLANTGVMVNPNAEYVKAELDGKKMIIAKDLLEIVAQKTGKEWKVLESMRGKLLEGLRYEHPLTDWIPFSKEIEEKGWRIVLSDRYVTMTDGSGLVHCAPGHGAEDFEVGKDNHLPVVCNVRLNGKFDEGIPALSGMPARAASDTVIYELEKRGALLHQEKIVHDYPKCWRCESPLLLISIPQWFFKVSSLRERMLEENEKVKWSPDWAGRRFKNWIESLGDWPISRQRYWGIPLPIWTCPDGHIKVIGAVEELGPAGKKLKDLHRPYVDKITMKCDTCGAEMFRVPDVLDVWFDSGLCSWASLGWPKSKETFDKMWPADLNIEGPDQIRGWWNSQLITSLITFDRAPFKTILFHGFVMDAHGVKMSKSKGNMIAPKDVVKKYSVDAFRYYLLSNPPWNDYYFDWKDMDAMSKTFMIIVNVFNFVENYVPKVGIGDLQNEDKWILSRLNTVVGHATGHFENYEQHKAAQELRDFIVDEVSRTYIKLIRDRVWPAYGGDAGAFFTLYTLCKTLSRMLAPFAPYLAEDIHQRIARKLGEGSESVHLCSWPSPDKSSIKPELEEGMKTALAIIEGASALRAKAKVKLRWPLATLTVGGDEKAKAAVTFFSDSIKKMANVKDVQFGHASWQTEHGGIKLWLDTEITPELKREAMVRELVRYVQDMRKKAKLVVSDRIALYAKGIDLTGFEDMLKAEVGASKIVTKKVAGKKSTMEFEGAKIEVGIEVSKKR